MRKIKVFNLGIIAALVAAVSLLAGCVPATTGTDSTTTSGSSTQSFLIMIGFIVVLFALMYFLTIRPQRKRQQEQAKMLQNLQRGDRVVTIGGLYGTVESTDDNSVVIKVESGSTMRFLRSAIASKVTDQPPLK